MVILIDDQFSGSIILIYYLIHFMLVKLFSFFFRKWKNFVLFFAGRFFVLVFLLQGILPGKSKAQIYSFNQDWNFCGIEVSKDTANNFKRKIDANWDTQFNIELINTNNSTFRNSPVLLDDELKNIDKKAWEKVTLPHCAFPQPVVSGISQVREGISYYRKQFFVPKKWKGKRITIEFEAAMQITNIWMNKRFAMQHQGGYLPFVVDVTDLVDYGQNNQIVLKVDNRPVPTVPPGKSSDKIDFLYYSGLYRNTWLCVKNLLHISNPNFVDKVAGGGVYVTYQNVSKQSATVNIQTHVCNEEELRQRSFNLTQQLIDNKGNIAATNILSDLMLIPGDDKHFNQSVNVSNPLLWHPDHPFLYTLKTTITDGEKNVIDENEIKIGVRSIAISKESGLLVNGEPLKIKGTNRHQSYPYIGNALSDNANYRDAFIIKSAGMNMIRSGHYPMAPSFLSACDELGLLLIDCTPGWQFFNQSPEFERNVMSDIRQMIRRDRNHPCVALWEVSLNESYPPVDFRCRQNATAKSEFLGEENFYTSGDSYYKKACWDVPYDDWNGDPGARDNTTYPDNAFLIREYGDYEFGGERSTSRQLRANGETALLQQAWNHQWELNKNLQKYPRCLGGLTWAFFDGVNGNVPGIEAWGSADLFRIPKYSYYFFQSQRSTQINKSQPIPGGPMVYIANTWSERTSPAKVVVYSNCEEVGLYLNDKLIAIQKPDSGPETDYGTNFSEGGNPFDGGNANRLWHPPFTFFNVGWQKGTLKAVGLINGEKVARYTVTTPESPDHVELQTNLAGKPLKADGGDVVFVYARILDKNNTVCPISANTIKLLLQGDARIISPVEVNAEAGIASFLVQSGSRKSKIKLSAISDNLSTGKLILTQD